MGDKKKTQPYGQFNDCLEISANNVYSEYCENDCKKFKTDAEYIT